MARLPLVIASLSRCLRASQRSRRSLSSLGMRAATFSPVSPVCDAHCHLQDERFRRELFDEADDARAPASDRLQAVIQRAEAAGVTHVVSCACYKQDWAALELLLAVQRQRAEDEGTGGLLEIVPSFGLHPWWAQHYVAREAATGEGEQGQEDDVKISDLRELLVRYPNASLGEIGLCKSARGKQVPIDVQLSAMRAQLALAAEMDRTCVIHCVGHYGKLLEVLTEFHAKQKLPPRIVLHSYSGSPDMIPAFLALGRAGKLLDENSIQTRVFFSLNAKQLTDTKSNKAAACCSTMPISSLLLETDAPDQSPSLEAVQAVSTECAIDAATALRVGDTLLAAGLNEPTMVQLAIHRAAHLRALSVAELTETVFQNSRDAFGF